MPRDDEASIAKRKKFIYTTLNLAMPTAYGKFQAEKLADVFIEAIDSYDTKVFVSDAEKYWSPEFADATGKLVIERIVSASAQKIIDYCDLEHPEPKSCECQKYAEICVGMR